MRNRTPTMLVALLAVLLVAACATLSPTSDPVLVRAEQSLATALDVTDALVQLDYTHRDALAAAVPGAHAVAERIRVKGPAVFKLAASAMDTYRANRTPENKATLQTTLAVVADLFNSAQQVLAQWGGAK
jgi:hypothetical protein